MGQTDVAVGRLLPGYFVTSPSRPEAASPCNSETDRFKAESSHQVLIKPMPARWKYSWPSIRIEYRHGSHGCESWEPWPNGFSLYCGQLDWGE